MSTSLGKRDRDDNDSNEDDDLDLNLKAPPKKKQRIDETHNRKKSDRSDTNESNNSLSGLSSRPIAAVNKVIVLNVGGIKYTTTLSTLTGYESMLKARFSGNYSMEPMDDGSYFFDRDGNLFQYILKYLRTGKVLIPEAWNKVELHAFYVEVQYFAVTSLLKLLSLRFFDSKILTHDAMKQKLISKISEYAKESMYGFQREVFPTKEWVLQFEYNRSTQTQRDHKKAELFNVVDEGHMPLVLVLADGQIYGRLMPNHLRGNSWMSIKFDSALTFRWPSPQHLRNPHDPDDQLQICDSINDYMTAEEKENHKSPLHGYWILSNHPYVIAATEEGCYDADFIIKGIDEQASSDGGKYVQRIEVWNLPSHTRKTLDIDL